MAEGSETVVSSYMVPTIRIKDPEIGQPSTLEQDASIIGASGSSTERGPGNSRDELTSRQSFFQTSNGVSTTGGQFVNATNFNHNSYHYYSSRTEEIDTGQSQQQAATTLNPWLRSTEGCSTSCPGPFSYPNPLPIMNSLDIYCRHLAAKRRGYPLWVPNPDINSPLNYQREGVCIGDVGIITPSGQFDFMFNICQPADHQFNVSGVPDYFEPFKPALQPTDIRKDWNIHANKYIASPSVMRSYEREYSDPDGISFKATASEGAILAIPGDTLSEDLKNVSGFRRYVSANLLSWYRFVMSQGREVENGDIRLVIGVDKTTDWGMAVFATLSDQKDDFHLNFKPVGHRSRGAMYNWECSGMSELKSGPDTFVIDTLRSQDNSQPTTIRNQCLFVRTLNVMLRADIWKHLESEFGPVQDVETSGIFNNTAVHFIDSSYHPSCFFDSLNTSNWPSQTQHGFGRSTATLSTQAAANVAHTVHLASLNINQFPHPSKVLNEALLKHHPHSQMVITSDNDWINAIMSNDEKLPSSNELVSRILSNTTICKEQGALFLDAKTGVQENPNLSAEKRESMMRQLRAHIPKVHPVLQAGRSVPEQGMKIFFQVVPLKDKDGKATEKYIIENSGGMISRGNKFAVYANVNDNQGNKLAILVAEEVMTSSSILAFPPGHPFIPLPLSAVATKIRATIKLYIHPPMEYIYSVVKDFAIDIVVVPVEGEADVSMQLDDSNKITLCILRQIKAAVDCHYTLPHQKIKKNSRDIIQVLKGMSFFFWQLDRTRHNTSQSIKENKALLEDVHVCFYELEENDGVFIPVGENLYANGVVDFVPKEEVTYRLEIKNESKTDLYPCIYYFHIPDFSILKYYGIGCIECPLPSGSTLEVGYASGGTVPFKYCIPEGQDMFVGILKIFLFSMPTDLGDLSKEFPFERSWGSRIEFEFPRMSLSWCVIDIPIIQRRRSI